MGRNFLFYLAICFSPSSGCHQLVMVNSLPSGKPDQAAPGLPRRSRFDAPQTPVVQCQLPVPLPRRTRRRASDVSSHVLHAQERRPRNHRQTQGLACCVESDVHGFAVIHFALQQCRDINVARDNPVSKQLQCARVLRPVGSPDSNVHHASARGPS